MTPPDGIYQAGTVVTLTVVPVLGYSFDRWGGDAAGRSAIIDITMDGPKDVVAYFKAFP